MLSKKDKATALTAAPKNNQRNVAYRNSVSTSMVKLQIGTLLLALQGPLSRKQQKICWILFEARLRAYIDLKTSGGTI